MIGAYIANTGSGNVTVIDTSTNTINTTISLPGVADPNAVAVTPDGTKAYVLNAASGASVFVIDTATNTIADTITVSVNGPVALAVTPDGSKLYLVNAGNGHVQVINTSTKAIIATLNYGSIDVEGVTVSPDGTKAYIAVEGAQAISVVNTSTSAITTTISVGAGPSAIAFTPDNSKAYVSIQNSAKVLVINTSTNVISSTILLPTGTGSNGITITPDGTKAYVANSASGIGHVTVIDTSTNNITATVVVGSDPTGVSATPDSSQVYVTNSNSGNVSVINTSTNSVVATITVGTQPDSFGQFIQSQSESADMPSPQGRLTLSSSAPVMTADATAQSTIYYLPYQGAITPVYNGSTFVNQLLGSSGISLALDSNSGHTGYQASGSLFDIFAFMNSGTLTLGTGPAWTNSTTRSAAITQVNGIWVNNASITLRFGSASGNTASVSANQATYLGTMYATANGQTGMACFPTAASGGTNNILGLWNAYNRVSTKAQCQEAAASWTYSTNTARSVNNSNSNRISFIDGLGQSAFIARYSVCGTNSLSNGESIVGIGVNSNTAMSNSWGQTESNITQILCADISSYPLIGFNYVQAMEQVFSGTVTYDGSGVYENFILQIDM